MKQINAYIVRHKLEAVIRALHKVHGLTGLSVFEGQGHGLSWAEEAVSTQLDFQPTTKLEVICRAELAEAVVAAIEKAARTGLRNDGKIYVCAVEQAVRISTGQRGESAV